MLFRSKRKGDLETYRDIAADVEESDFVPYACHYNPHTLLTKNGELLQIIKITGLAHEVVGSRALSLRDTIRKAVRDHIPSDAYAIWFHTLRGAKDLSAKGEYGNAFAREVHDAWESLNQFSRQYGNEVYITVVRDGQSAAIFNKKNFLTGLSPANDRGWRNRYIDTAFGELEAVVTNVLEALQEFGARRLTVVEEQGEFYSEPARFIEQLVNLVDHPMPMADIDLSDMLTGGEVTFGFNAMEVRLGSARRFAAILTLKEYKEASLAAIDAFLQQPMEFIVTQCINFINPDAALVRYREQKKLTVLSGDIQLGAISELDLILNSQKNSQIDFGEQQLSIFIIANSVRELEKNVRHAKRFFTEHGLVAVREDLRFEQCYWAQLPGNFEFVARMTPTNTMHAAGFANLYNFPAGKAEGNRWGHAVTTFHTAAGTPYFFNFHVRDNGHTSIVGPHGAGKSVLTNFLLCEAMKFNPRIVYFDVTGAASEFIERLGGNSYNFLTAEASEGRATPPLNPFALEPTENNRAFLRRWLGVLARMAGKTPDEPLKQAIHKAADEVFALPAPQRNFSAFAAALLKEFPAAREGFAPWLNDGAFGHAFHHAADVMAAPPRILGLNLSGIFDQPSLLIPIMALLLQRLDSLLDGTPTLLVFDEAWALLENTPAAMDIQGWLGRLSKKNALGIFSTEDIDAAGASALTRSLLAGMASQIYLADPAPDETYMRNFGLSEAEYEYLEVMDPGARHFLLKREGETIVGEMNLTGMEHVLPILSGEPEDTAAEAA